MEGFVLKIAGLETEMEIEVVVPDFRGVVFRSQGLRWPGRLPTRVH